MQTHKYYKQVQTQIFVTESQFCDFVVWTTKTLATVRVMPDVELWETLLPTAQTFFYKVVLPELVARHYTHPLCLQLSYLCLQPIPSPQTNPKNEHRRAQSEKHWQHYSQVKHPSTRLSHQPLPAPSLQLTYLCLQLSYLCH